MRRVTRRPRLGLVNRAVSYGSHDSWRIGLRVATLLRTHFPAFWARHLADRSVTEENLARAGAAFVRLAGTQFELSEWFLDRAGAYADGRPAAALSSPLDELTQGLDEDVFDLLYEFVDAPQLAVYGIDLNEDDGWEGMNSLAVGLWWITMLADEGMLDGLSEELRDTLLDVPRVDCRGADGRLSRLCAALDAEEGLGAGGVGLGTLLAYAHQTTGNPFADIGQFELYEAYGYGGGGTFNWETALAEAAEQQQAARRIAEVFGRLDIQIRAWSGELIHLGETIGRVAAEAGLPVFWPGADDSHDADDTEDLDDDTNDTEVAALAAA